ncbi:growth arrest and DNA damage-inducible proteins-interacting protein 1 [Trematomus bernacchii]|uniref:growth arrest and DNA damage-inducible proteins-interacting protein 1 n=1 Tax=Trematomus bernacchii TaxID=40690 RepID=UPI00146CC394|nr:growth arrest and DNA damage-inducible proteins-interacting protein 1 [Trematomus bernacchii]
MAASMVCGRTSMFFRSLNGISGSKTLLSANSQTLLLQTASYNPKPLRLNLREPYIPDRSSEKTPDWQKTPRYDRKLFGRYGSASGIDPASLWPNHEQLERIIEEENEWHPPLEVKLKNLQEKERQVTEKRQAKEKLIAANMAKMPKMIADWREEKRQTKAKMNEEKTRRSKLLDEARESLGQTLDPRNHKFLEMVADLEKEEKKKQKLLKKKQKHEQAAVPPPPPPPAAAP